MRLRSELACWRWSSVSSKAERKGSEGWWRRVEALIAALGREPRQRSTLYGPVPAARRAAAFAAPPLEAARTMPLVKPPPAIEAADAARLTRPSASG